MAAERLDALKAKDEKPASPEAAEVAPAAPRGRLVLSWLPLVLSLLLMPALAYAVTVFVLAPHLQKSVGLAGAPAVAATETVPNNGSAGKAKPAAGDIKESVPMSKLLVNVAGTLGSRYLLSSLALVGTGADFKAKVAKHEAQLRDQACGILSAKTIADLEKPGARNAVRGELVTSFNNILGGTTVQEIYFTEFAIQ